MPKGVVLAGMSLLLVVLGLERSAHACLCSFDYVAPIWPNDGATEVPLDAPIVIAGFELEHAKLDLRNEDGAMIELIERRRLVPSDLQCSMPEYGFFAPRELLEANRSYELLASPAGETAVAAASIRFTTGAATRRAPTSDLDLQLFGVVAEGQRMLQAFVQTPVDEPLFALARGETLTATHTHDPVSSGTRRFGVPFGFVSCAGMTVVDVSGATLVNEDLCRPTKCTPMDALTISSCGGEVFGGPDWAGWQRIQTLCNSAASASDPTSDVASDGVAPALGDGANEGEDTMDSEPSSLVPGEGRRVVGGCSQAQDVEHRASYWLLAIALGAAVRRRR